MSDSIKKYEELYDKKLEEKMISKGFGEKDSHDEEHVMKVVCKHFDLELTDTWSSDCDHYIYEESTADGYTVYVSLYEANANVCVSENPFVFISIGNPFFAPYDIISPILGKVNGSNPPVMWYGLLLDL